MSATLRDSLDPPASAPRSTRLRAANPPNSLFGAPRIIEIDSEALDIFPTAGSYQGLLTSGSLSLASGHLLRTTPLSAYFTSLTTASPPPALSGQASMSTSVALSDRGAPSVPNTHLTFTGNRDSAEFDSGESSAGGGLGDTSADALTDTVEGSVDTGSYFPTVSASSHSAITGNPGNGAAGAVTSDEREASEDIAAIDTTPEPDDSSALIALPRNPLHLATLHYRSNNTISGAGIAQGGTYRLLTFPKFKKLPLEIQVMIRREAAKNMGRVVELRIHRRPNSTKYDFFTEYNIPPLLHLCQSARFAYLGDIKSNSNDDDWIKYEMLGEGAKNCRKSAFFNFDYDILFVRAKQTYSIPLNNPNGTKTYFSIDSSRAGEALYGLPAKEKVRNLAICTTLLVGDYFSNMTTHSSLFKFKNLRSLIVADEIMDVDEDRTNICHMDNRPYYAAKPIECDCSANCPSGMTHFLDQDMLASHLKHATAHDGTGNIRKAIEASQHAIDGSLDKFKDSMYGNAQEGFSLPELHAVACQYHKVSNEQWYMTPAGKKVYNTRSRAGVKE